MENPDELITIQTFVHPSEAYPLMTRLQSEGIECILDGENTLNVMPFYSQAIGGVRLMVRSGDAPRALEIISKHGPQKVRVKTADQETIHADPENAAYSVRAEEYCPKCESSSVFRKKFPSFKIILIILFAAGFISFMILQIYLPLVSLIVLLIPLAFGKKHRYCATCGHHWMN